MVINVIVIGFFGIGYIVCKMIIIWRENLDDEEKFRKILEIKEFVYWNLFFVLYVIYLSIFLKIVVVMLFVCYKFCWDEKEELCNEYLKVDYSI